MILRVRKVRLAQRSAPPLAALARRCKACGAHRGMACTTPSGRPIAAHRVRRLVVVRGLS